MSNQRNTDLYSQGFRLSWEDAARLRSAARSLDMPATPFKGRKIRKAVRRMSPACLAGKIIEESVRDVTPDEESLLWMDRMQKRARDIRARQDERVRAGAAMRRRIDLADGSVGGGL